MHKSVLLNEILGNLAIKAGETVVDCTVNGGGHSKAILEALGGKIILVAIDADSKAIERATTRLEKFAKSVIFGNENFRNLNKVLATNSIKKADKFLFDLGWSSNQLDSGKGFSFQKDEKLSMTYSNEGKEEFNAEAIVNEWDEENLVAILLGYGEEKFAKKIARAIVASREQKPIATTFELVDIVKGAVPPKYRHGKIHPATKTFQSLRITVNDELGALKEALGKAVEHLNKNGRIAVISFHSLEDRIVKVFFKDLKEKGIGKSLTKKPIIPSEEETRGNPRARSAKLRVFEKNI